MIWDEGTSSSGPGACARKGGGGGSTNLEAEAIRQKIIKDYITYSYLA